MQRRDDGGLGNQLVGDRITVNHRNVQVTKLIGEGGFSYVYLVKDITVENKSESSNAQSEGGRTNNSAKEKNPVMVLKVTSIHSRAQRDIADKEAKLLSRLSHPSIIKMHDACYRTAPQHTGVVGTIMSGGNNKDTSGIGQASSGRPQHLILMEYCEGGHALDVCNKLASAGKRFDIAALIIAFGQICNAVSYLHAQRPPIVHRDLKPVNFLVKNGAYKLCDFGSAVFGHVELKSQRDRQEAEEVIQKTTTQMFRAPEMVDLFMSSKLTQSTDVWALGCCLYSLAFLQNCFEEGSNLAILSRNFKIPDDNPYGKGLVELIERMLTIDGKTRADMTEVILCLSAIYSGRPLPPRKKGSKPRSTTDDAGIPIGNQDDIDNSERVGVYRTDGQGFQEKKKKKKKEAPSHGKKLASDSAAARRLRGREVSNPKSPSVMKTKNDSFEVSFPAFPDDAAPTAREGLAFSTDANNISEKSASSTSAFTKFEAMVEKVADNSFGTFCGDSSWGNANPEISPAEGFPTTFSTGGSEQDRFSDTSMKSRLSELKISEEETGRCWKPVNK
mmetsp:Transcript_8575/g.9820  ORF Transcript_8575/g.9820 Transcript_8575/m.9820 type:complete len:559 (-) Transcript_8575:326-2002(-)|eukprot:CAMPEP_0194148634 /NCGR_PEP_ID=MMETSP0152-20130528/33590_1 /TAXON_ID=1049557 /ORGANISM="Thalassiothrix antarctica, Strain L6-D1" /LENGTH=558 /DNA_ID=CAMNT_0038850287 /DNA_START=264 /DNA_END=1940 /DNA_ORIENTATION=+